MILPRFLTAIIAIPTFVYSIIVGGLLYVGVLMVLILFSLYEYYTIVQSCNVRVFKRLGLIFGCVMMFLLAYDQTQMNLFPISEQYVSFFLFLLTTLFFFCALFCVIVSGNHDRTKLFHEFSLTITGIFFIVLNLSHLFWIRGLQDGLFYSLYLYCTIWGLDSFAYIFGKMFGKRKLSPHISPNKTYEGLVLSSIFTFGCAYAYVYVHCEIFNYDGFFHGLTMMQLLWLIVLLIIVVPISDLIESVFKRSMGVKDSGSILPGHGGCLDRLDSLILSAPLYYYVLMGMLYYNRG